MWRVLVVVGLLVTSSTAMAATERMPCASSEAKVTPAGSYLWVACPGEGRLMPEGMEVHFQADKRDFVVRGQRLVALDGPVGGGIAPDPRLPLIEQRWPGLLQRLLL